MIQIPVATFTNQQRDLSNSRQELKNMKKQISAANRQAEKLKSEKKQIQKTMKQIADINEGLRQQLQKQQAEIAELREIINKQKEINQYYAADNFSGHTINSYSQRSAVDDPTSASQISFLQESAQIQEDAADSYLPYFSQTSQYTN
eukprot:94078_1